MTTTTTTNAASYIIAPLKSTIWYASKLVEDIPADDFARKHEGINSPAFCLGHLTLYTTHVLKLLGRDDLASDNTSDLDELFAFKKECVDNDARYPDKATTVQRYLAGHNAIVEALESASEEQLAAENPTEGFKDSFPTVGSAVNFLCCAHHMTHLGQISAWRRARGMPVIM